MRVTVGSEEFKLTSGLREDNFVIEGLGQGYQTFVIRHLANSKNKNFLLLPYPGSNFIKSNSDNISDIQNDYADFYKENKIPKDYDKKYEIKYFCHMENIQKLKKDTDMVLFEKYGMYTGDHLYDFCFKLDIATPPYFWLLRVYKLKKSIFLPQPTSQTWANLKNQYDEILSELNYEVEAEPVLSDEEYEEIKKNILLELENKSPIDDLIKHMRKPYGNEDVEPIYIEPQQLKKVAEDLTLSFNVFSTISNAINRENHLILQGIPGTGKTELADALCELCVEKGYLNDYIQTTATSDWSTYDTIGGLMPDRKGNLYFSEGIVLKSIKENNLLIIDEINRADIDKAFGPLFTVLSGKPVELNYKYYKNDSDEGQNIKIVPKDINKSYFDEETATYVVGKNWRIIGTMNTYDKDSLYDLSYAFMRRFFMVDVDAPIKTDFEQLIRKFGRNLDPDYLEKVFKLLEINEMKDSRKLGPAIFIDLIEYLLSSQGPYDKITEDNVLEDAVIGFVIPQFEGLPQKSLAALETFLIKDIGLDEKTINKKFLDIQETF